MPGDLDFDDIPYEDILSGEEELEVKKEAENRKRGELLASVDFSRYAGGPAAGQSAQLFSRNAASGLDICI